MLTLPDDTLLYDVYLTNDKQRNFLMRAPMAALIHFFNLEKLATERVRKEVAGKGSCDLHNCRGIAEGNWLEVKLGGLLWQTLGEQAS